MKKWYRYLPTLIFTLCMHIYQDETDILKLCILALVFILCLEYSYKRIDNET